jgi:TatD DNase family protein
VSVPGAGSPDAGGVGWIDSHCHLQDRYRPEGPGATGTVAEARAAGVSGLVCVGTDAATSRQAIDLVAVLRNEAAGFGSWATVGLHPHEAAAGVDEVSGVLEQSLASHPDVVVGVGECGLDYHYDNASRHAQRDAFAAQIALASRHDLTLVVHSRSAWDDTLDVLLRQGEPARTIFHCFTGGPDEARRCLDLGAYLSFSGIVTFKNADDVRAAARLCPLDRLLVETDAPFLAPVPHRGQPNRPAWVAEVGTAVAGLKGLGTEEFAEISRSVTMAAFALE